MDIKRGVYKDLVQWKTQTNRKPLLIRGARQVGKTTLVRQFSKEFKNYIELNLERDSEKALFEIDDINTLLNAAYLLKGKKVDNKPCLLFIDEIQESPKAIQKLRYFYEERPDIYIIAAGSLLEFALNKVASFPVGRVSYLYLSPLNFEEYLSASQQQAALEMLYSIPIPDYAHSRLIDLYHEYTIIGGMPEIVSHYITNKNISQLSILYKQLWQAYKDDVEKYAHNATERKIIRHVIDSAPFETDRIKFEGFGKSNYRSREVGEAIRMLDLAGVIRLIYPTTSIEPPIITDLKKRPRLQFLDTGLLNHILLIQGEMLKINDLSDYHRGKIIQHLLTQELIAIEKTERYKPHFWLREEKDSNSEVDLVYQFEKYIIPIEIKSGKQGTLRSLHQFVERTNHKYAIRVFAGNFSVEKTITPSGTPYLLMNIPYYLGTKLPLYIEFFIKNYSL